MVTSETGKIADRALNMGIDQPERATHAYEDWGQVFLSIFLIFIIRAQYNLARKSTSQRD
jgi:hypothetical protein